MAFITVGASAVARTSVSASELLAMLPRGAYTTARTINRNSVFEFETHVQRTASSAALMQTELPSGDAATACTSAPSLRPHVVNNMGRALSAYWAANSGPPTDASPSGAAADARHHEVKLSTLLTWGCDAIATLRRVAADAAIAVDHDAFSAALAAECGVDAPFVLITHACRLPPRRAAPIRVMFMGHPREAALAKDSDWIRKRKPLEAAKPADVEEIILVDDTNGAAPAMALEGTQTNFFVIKDGAIHTAGEGVLEGTVRRLVLEVAQRDGIPVKLQAPCMEDMQHWDAAFISSTSRLVLPIDELIVPKHEDGSVAEIRRIMPPSTLLRTLEASVAAQVAAHSTRLI